MKAKRFIKNWALPISMAVGAAGYFLCRSLPLSVGVRQAITDALAYVQPMLIFSMLMLTFCRVSLSDMRLRRWQAWLLLYQAAAGILLCWLLVGTDSMAARLCMESAMICFLCPTATAAAVVTSKLGGNAGTLTAYTILINLLAAVLIPALIPHVNPQGGIGFWPAFWLIIRRVFPLLICPLVAATAIRRYCPTLLRRLTAIPDLAFHLWTVALALAIAVTTRIIVHSNVEPWAFLAVAIGSASACILQFAMGRWVGSRYDDAISSGQACGQKNTILAIWVGYTFLDPLTALAGGFYSIWHNVYNSWQLYQANRPAQKIAK